MDHTGDIDSGEGAFVQFSVGRRHVYVWTEREEDAWLALRQLRLEGRAGVYRWQAERQPDGSIFVWDAMKLARQAIAGPPEREPDPGPR